MGELGLGSDLWKRGVPEGRRGELEALAASLSQAVEPLNGQEKWKLEVVYAGKYGGAHRKPWDQLVEFVRLVHRDAANAQEPFVKYGPEIVDHPVYADHDRIAVEILAHLEPRAHS